MLYRPKLMFEAFMLWPMMIWCYWKDVEGGILA